MSQKMVPLFVYCPESQALDMGVGQKCSDTNAYNWYHKKCHKKDFMDDGGFIHCGCAKKRFISSLKFDCGSHEHEAASFDNPLKFITAIAQLNMSIVKSIDNGEARGFDPKNESEKSAFIQSLSMTVV